MIYRPLGWVANDLRRYEARDKACNACRCSLPGLDLLAADHDRLNHLPQPTTLPPSYLLPCAPSSQLFPPLVNHPVHIDPSQSPIPPSSLTTTSNNTPTSTSFSELSSFHTISLSASLPLHTLHPLDSVQSYTQRYPFATAYPVPSNRHAR